MRPPRAAPGWTRLPPPSCDVPAPDAAKHEDRVRDFLHQNSPGLAKLYDAARIARHYSTLPGIGLLISHLVREIGNGLANVVLGQASKTNPMDEVSKAWSDVQKTLPKLAAAVENLPEREEFWKATNAIGESVQAHKSANKGARKRAAELFAELAGLHPSTDDPSSNAWHENVDGAVPLSHFQAQHGNLPEAAQGLARFTKLEDHLRSLSADAVEGADQVDDLLGEIQRGD